MMNAQSPTKNGSTDEAWTISRLLSWTGEYLASAGVDEARLASEVLLAHALGCRRIDLYARMDSVPDAESRDRFRGWVARAAKHEPIAYLVGQREFFSLSFIVTSAVLIPRPETETLVEFVIDLCSAQGASGARLLDMGTGSGCIAISVLSQLPTATVLATDISESALVVANENAERHGVSDRFESHCADGLQLGHLSDGGFDVVMSNPPYVAADDMTALSSCVKDYEPSVAITDKSDGLSFYRMIARDAPALLRDNGHLVVEVGHGRADRVIAAMTEGGGLSHERTINDRVLGVERVLVFRGC